MSAAARDRGGRLLVGAWYAALVVGLSWPALLSPAEHALGSPEGDGLKHLWTLWWMRTSVWREGLPPFHTDLANHPYGMDLFPIEPLNGLVAVLLPFVPLLLLANLLVFVNLWALGLAGHLLGRQLGGSRAAGLATGTLLLGSATAAFTVHVGVGELLHLAFVPLGLCLLQRLAREPSRALVLALAACLVAAVVSGFYVGLCLGVGVVAWTLCALPFAPQRGPFARGALGAAALSLALVVPVVWLFSTSYQAPGGIEGGLVERLLTPLVPVDVPAARLEPWQLLSPGREPETGAAAAYGGGRYLGWLTVGMALLGVIRRPRASLPWLGTGLVGLVLALGTHLTVAGAELSTFPLPFAWLNQVLAVVAEPVNFPVRFLVLTVTALGALAALGLDGARGWRGVAWLLAPLAVLEVAGLQMLPRPWATFRPTPLPELAVLAEGPGPAAVLDLGLVFQPDGLSRRLALSAQLVHQRPLHTIPIERVEYFAREGVHYVEALNLSQALRPYYEGRHPGPSADLERRLGDDLALLRADGFEWALVVERTDGRKVLPRIGPVLDGLLGSAVVRTDRAAAWRLPDVELPPGALEGLRRTHDARRMQLAAQDRGAVPLERPDVVSPPGPAPR